MPEDTPMTILLEFINSDISLDQDEKQKYIDTINKVANAQPVDEELFAEISSYLDSVILQAEEEAMINEDPDEILKLANVRESRNELEKILLQLRTSNTSNNIVDNPGTPPVASI